jgi:pyruvate formate lyase activating enzyme
MGFKDAEYWKKLPEKKVKCFLCPHNCFIDNGEVGECKTRMNILGKLKSLNYGKVYEIKHCKIEDIGLFHFLPESDILKVVVAGKNLNGNFKDFYEFGEVPEINLFPSKLVKEADKLKENVIVYSGEPGIYIEYLKDCVKKGEGKKHVIFSKGFISKEVIKEISDLVDGGVFEIFSMKENFYESVGGNLKDVLRAIKEFYKSGKWLEIQMYLVKELHEDLYDVRKFISWVLNELNNEVPIYFYSVEGNEDFLERVRKIALDVGMKFVYTSVEKNTYCPNCKNILVMRGEENRNNLKSGKCLCGEKISGIWK